MSKEEIYDSKIFPLMEKIIEICKENKIAMFATFSIPGADDPDLVCTSALLTDEYNPPESFIRAFEKIRPRETPPMLITVEHEDGSKDITAVLG